MTCIVGLVDEARNCVNVGGDAAATSLNSISIERQPKVYRVNDFIIGCTTSFRMMQLIRFAFNPRFSHNVGFGAANNPSQSADLFEYMCTSFVDELITTLKSGGFASKNNEVEHGGKFIVASGSDFAMGSLCTSGDIGDYTTEERVELAIKAAATHSPSVSSPFTLRSTISE
jgi:hypothetical protein